MDPAPKQRLDTSRARDYLRQPGHLTTALRLLFPNPNLDVPTDTSRLKQLDGHAARTRHLGQGICRVLIGDGYLRPITPTPDKKGSGGRRTRQKLQDRPGHYDQHGVMTFGHATLTRKGLQVLDEGLKPTLLSLNSSQMAPSSSIETPQPSSGRATFIDTSPSFEPSTPTFTSDSAGGTDFSGGAGGDRF